MHLHGRTPPCGSGRSDNDATHLEKGLISVKSFPGSRCYHRCRGPWFSARGMYGPCHDPPLQLCISVGDGQIVYCPDLVLRWWRFHQGRRTRSVWGSIPTQIQAVLLSFSRAHRFRRPTHGTNNAISGGESAQGIIPSNASNFLS